MADVIMLRNNYAKTEIIIHEIDMTNKLATGVTVSSATATHIPPSGTPLTPSVGAISNNVVPILLGATGLVGWHDIEVLATLSTGEKYGVLLRFKVIY